jgi:hypothetical protein
VGRKSNEKWSRRLAETAALAATAASQVKRPPGIAGVLRTLLDYWPIVGLGVLITIFGFVTDVRSWFTSGGPAVAVAQEQRSGTGDFNPKANIRVVNFSRATGEGTIAIGVVNQGFKPVQNFYMEWWIDASVGTVSAGPAVLSQQIPFENRRMTQFSAFITKQIPPGAHHPVWNMKLTNARRAGVFPMRLIFRDPTATLTYPAAALDPQGMSLTISDGPTP